MLGRIWRSIVRWFRRVLGLETSARRLRRRSALAAAIEQQRQIEAPPLVDADYEFLFMQLLEGVAHGWQQERVLKFFADLKGRITDEQWVGWLRRFGDRLLASPAPNNELAARMVRLGEIGIGQLGDVAYEIGMQLLLRQSTPPVRQVQTAPPPLPIETPIEAPLETAEEIEPQPVTIDELLDLLQQDSELVRDIAAQLQIDTSDPQEIVQALINKAATINQSTNDAEAWFTLGVQQQSAGDFEAAIASYDQSLAIDPHASAVWSNRGVALADLGRYEEAIACFEQVLQIEPTEHWAWSNRGLALAELRRYDDAIASFQQGLNYVQPNNQPEAWGQFHRAIGNAYYDRGRAALHPRNDWRQAVTEYEQALRTLTPEISPPAYLQVLQDILRVYLSLGQTAQAEPFGQRGTQLLQQVIQEEKQLGRIGTPLAVRFVGLNQLMVDLAVQSGQFVPALELAEKSKNACLNWFLNNWNDEIPSPTWAEIQSLLNPATAIIYWHLSPAALTTFVLKYDAPEPILVAAPTSTNTEELPRSVQRLRELEYWIADWNQKYQEYKQSESKDGQGIGTWRGNLTEKLNNLAIILDVAVIIAQIPENVKHLILIPHRDLHRFPLQALFPDQFTTSYLPSAQLHASSVQADKGTLGELLSVECPTQEGILTQIEAAAIAQLFENPTRFADAIATKERVIAALSSGYNLFHFTGHSSDNFKTPSQSALTLTNSEQIALTDICRLSLDSYQLVSLSASESAIAPNQFITTEYVGLVSGFLSRGVANVVSSLWTVEADSRTLFAIEFYRRFKTGIPPAQALKEAQQWLRTATYSQLAQWYQDLATQLSDYSPSISEHLKDEAHQLQTDPDKMSQSQPPYAHPYHWAAFAIAGR